MLSNMSAAVTAHTREINLCMLKIPPHSPSAAQRSRPESRILGFSPFSRS